MCIRDRVIDFSKVEIEPMFKDFVDFDSFSKCDFRAVKAVSYTHLDVYKRQLLYIGKSTTRKLALFGIKTIGDLARADEDVLNSHLGKMGSILWSFPEPDWKAILQTCSEE